MTDTPPIQFDSRDLGPLTIEPQRYVDVRLRDDRAQCVILVPGDQSVTVCYDESPPTVDWTPLQRAVMVTRLRQLALHLENQP